MIRPRLPKLKVDKTKAANVLLLGGAGGQIGGAIGYGVGGDDGKVPILVKGKLKKKKKAPTIQRAATVGGLLAGTSVALLRKK